MNRPVQVQQHQQRRPAPPAPPPVADYYVDYYYQGPRDPYISPLQPVSREGSKKNSTLLLYLKKGIIIHEIKYIVIFITRTPWP